MRAAVKSSRATLPRKSLNPHWVSWMPDTASSRTNALNILPMDCR